MLRRAVRVLAAVALGAFLCLAPGAGCPGRVEKGALAPGFSLGATGGRTVSLADYRGKKFVILYFFGSASEAADALEARQFRDDYPELSRKEAEVIGVAAEPVAALDQFARRESLPFPLASDPDGAAARAYGVAVHGGRSVRATFVMDKEGVVRYVNYRVMLATQLVELNQVLNTLLGEEVKRRNR